MQVLVLSRETVNVMKQNRHISLDLGRFTTKTSAQDLYVKVRTDYDLVLRYP